jgi:ABC-type antimicrobial peptide transport system permease subunit
MESVGTQEKLPFKRAMRISIQGIRIRLGRSLVTVSGVVLGIAFLMSNLTSQLILKAVQEERELKQTVDLMQALVKSEIGVIEGKQLAVVAFGEVSSAAEQLLSRIRRDQPAAISVYGIKGEAYVQKPLAGVGEGAVAMLVLGDSTSAGISLKALTTGMAGKVVLDTVDERQYPGEVSPSVRRELFFGDQVRQRQAEMKAKEKQALFRTAWIALISVFVTVIGVSNALLMSVTERFREIGTMKCLGALSVFIRTLFLIESSLIGIAGSIMGVVAGAILPMIVYGCLYGFSTVLVSLNYGLLGLAAIGSAVAGTILSVLAAIYPARVASNMLPAAALRSTV